MKARCYFLSLVLLAACQPVELDDDYPNTSGGKADTDSVFTLTLRATKAADTKALDLVNGTRLNQYWKNTEKVKVFRAGTYVGTLNVQPAAGEKPTYATLSGSVEVQGLAENDVLTLLIPRQEFDYTGQNGALTGTGSIEDSYDYGMATVTVNSIAGHTVTTTADARFQSQQSIYRFDFKDGDVQLQTKAFTIVAANKKLVQRLHYQGSSWTPVYGTIHVEKADPSAISFVSLRNDSNADDNYSFFILDSSRKLYLATKQIPASVLDGQGKFLSAQNINAVETCFPAITDSPGANPVIY